MEQKASWFKTDWIRTGRCKSSCTIISSWPPLDFLSSPIKFPSESLINFGSVLPKIPSTPGSLNESLNALEKDHKYLLEGDVFTKNNIETYISYKRENEVSPMDLRPHPHEFNLYYDV